ncbi:MAG: DsbE family thiol:disulfide interchange protein [Alphaproteobacteria bacterium GM202ARS2]|nr:DsbE family thiol:disulfide interchange protein [Alphaproteobacteria bacterium GM202ARS2]
MPPPLFYRLLPVYGILFLALVFAYAFTDEPTVPSPMATTHAPAPKWYLVRLDKPETLSPEVLHGRVSVVNFFASWCLPCVAEHPHITALAEHYPQVLRVGIAYKDSPQDAQRWLDTHSNPYTFVALDPVGRNALQWGVSGVPETFLIDTQGRIRYHLRAPIDPVTLTESLVPLLEGLLAEKP